MIVLWALLAFIAAAVIAFLLRDWIFLRKPPNVRALAVAPPAHSGDWTAQAGEEFASLPEAARCDLVFALSDLDDDRAQRVLVQALNDPSETVALAAAHALKRRGCADVVQRYAADHPGERAQRMLDTLALLDS
ncbi:MAG: hypothetical protein JOZ01_09560 [Candidatus Eremiobacteraeota bacterium]|nr:hypothetical protein [Candidatus Eremiobacteraeota bacterium]